MLPAITDAKERATSTKPGGGMSLRLEARRARQTINIAGIDVTPVPVNHLVPTFGLLVQNEVAAVVFTSDTYSTDEIWEVSREAEHLKGVFVDVSFPNELGKLAAASKHLTPELLAVEVSAPPEKSPLN